MIEMAFMRHDGKVFYKFSTGAGDTNRLMRMHKAYRAMPVAKHNELLKKQAELAKKPGVTLMLMHGRKDPKEDMSDWGFDAPLIKGVEYIHVTYMATFNVGFTNRPDFLAAKELTAWEAVDELALEMRVEEGLVVTKDGYFGDWEIQIP